MDSITSSWSIVHGSSFHGSWLIAHRGAFGESSINRVRSAISTSFPILPMMRLSCSENSSAFSNALARICSDCCNWLQNHLILYSFFLFVWFDGAKIRKKMLSRELFDFSYVFRAFINIRRQYIRQVLNRNMKKIRLKTLKCSLVTILLFIFAPELLCY